MHNYDNPPIASIVDIQEVEKADLPEAVMKWAPDATGGAAVTRKYYTDIPLAEWVFKGIQAKDIDEMSYAYDPIIWEHVEDKERPQLRRILKEIELYDISDVNWGANPATAGVKGLPVTSMTFLQHSSMVEATLEEFLTRVKDRKSYRELEGRTLSEANRGRLSKMVTEIEAILRETEPVADQAEVLNQLSTFYAHQS